MDAHKAKLAALLDSKEERTDNSLRGKALQRALQKTTPKTLTAYEWEQWYAEYGVPPSHKNMSEKKRAKPWWQWW
jgi:hypothetical protein